MNTADKKVVLDAITEAAVCLAAIPDFMAGERITNALHQLHRAGAIVEMKDHEEEFFEVGAMYNNNGTKLEFRYFDENGDPCFKEMDSDIFVKRYGLAPFSLSRALNFIKL